MSPSDDNESLTPVFEGWPRLFCHTNVVRIVALCKNYKIYKATRFYTCRVKRKSENNGERRKTDSVLFCGGFLSIISVIRIKRLIN